MSGRNDLVEDGLGVDPVGFPVGLQLRKLAKISQHSPEIPRKSNENWPKNADLRDSEWKAFLVVQICEFRPKVSENARKCQGNWAKVGQKVQINTRIQTQRCDMCLGVQRPHVVPAKLINE